MSNTIPTKYELEFYYRTVDRILMFQLETKDIDIQLLEFYRLRYGENIRYKKLMKLYKERLNYLTPNDNIKRVKEITQDEWESNMKDSIINQLDEEDTK